MMRWRAFGYIAEEWEVRYETISWVQSPNAEIDLRKGKPFKDFGQGFYLSDDYGQAEELAASKAVTLGGDAVVSEFEFEMEALLQAGLSIKWFDSYSD